MKNKRDIDITQNQDYSKVLIEQHYKVQASTVFLRMLPIPSFYAYVVKANCDYSDLVTKI